MNLSSRFAAAASTFLATLALSLTLAGCSGNDGAITVVPATTPLSDNGGDVLFTVEITEAREGGYESAKLRVKVIPDGGDAVDVACTFEDVDKNQKAGAKDRLVCSEPVNNVLGVSLAGTELEVELYATIEGEEERVGDATWTATAAK